MKIIVNAFPETSVGFHIFQEMVIAIYLPITSPYYPGLVVVCFS